MYKTIVLPIDGSEVATRAVKAGIEFAKTIKAERVVLVNVIQPFSSLVGFEGLSGAYAFSDEEVDDVMREAAEKLMKDLMKIAEEAGLKAVCEVQSDYNVVNGVLASVEKHKADLVYIASHGRGGFKHMLLGSVTAKLVSVCPVAVLIHR